MSNSLTREEILALEDITTKEVVVPEKIPVWGGNTFRIKQLTRGQQDEYLQRQYGSTRLKQDRKAKNQEISAVNLYGHDAWICISGIVDDNGKSLFQSGDEAKLKNKSGEAVGWLAREIVKFSGMLDDVTPDGKDTNLEEEAKNS